MRFMGSEKYPEQNYFECERYFNPIHKKIVLFMDGQLSDNFEIQNQFYQQIEGNYAKIIASSIPLIEEIFQNRNPNFKIKNADKELKLVGISLPHCDKKPIAWKISFETIHDLIHTFTLIMQDFEAQDIVMDG